jgi:hypothetical protein
MESAMTDSKLYKDLREEGKSPEEAERIFRATSAPRHDSNSDPKTLRETDQPDNAS